jgi:hypothetical protein
VDIKDDEFVVISKKGNVVEFVYKPSKYPGPIALNATIKQEKDANQRKCSAIQQTTAETI